MNGQDMDVRRIKAELEELTSKQQQVSVRLTRCALVDFTWVGLKYHFKPPSDRCALEGAQRQRSRPGEGLARQGRHCEPRNSP